MGVVERARSASRNIEETRLTVSLLILKLGDEYLGLHYTILSSFVCSNFSHNKNFLIKRKSKEKKMLVPLDIREILESFKKSSMRSHHKAVELETEAAKGRISSFLSSFHLGCIMNTISYLFSSHKYIYFPL